MGHPFLAQRNNYYYFAIWAVIVIAHVVFLVLVLNVQTALAIMDSVLFNLVLSLAGLSYWYVVEYGGGSSKGLSPSILTRHFLGGVLIVGLAYGISALISGFYFGGEAITDLMASLKIILGLFCFMIIVLLYYLEKYNRDLQERTIAEAKLDNERKQAELNLLKNQINPHFIFNSLNSISALTLHRPDDARSMLIKLSEFLRYSLGTGETELSDLKHELSNLEHYIEIEKVRFGKKLEYIEQVDPAHLDWGVPNMILQPLIENAIKHGLYESIDGVTINLKTHLQGDYLNIVITNGFDPEAVAPRGKGIGLKNVANRLTLIYGLHGLMKSSKEGGTFTVTLSIPKIESDD